MRGVIWIVLIFAVAVVAASTLGRNDGLVAIYYGHWRADLSLNLFVLLVLGGCFALVTAYRALESLITLPRRAAEWRALQRERGAQRALREAAAEFFAARYSRAQRSAQRALQLHAESPALRDDAQFRGLALLLAAGSLHRLQDRGRRDELLRDLLDGGGAAGATGEGARLLAAEWAIDDRDADAALQQLAAMPPGLARRTQALKLRLQAARMARQPLQALGVARLLTKHQGISPAAAQGLVRSLAAEVLDGARDADQLARAWRTLDAAEQRDATTASRAARRAVALDNPELARQWLRPHWDHLRELAAPERTEIAIALAEAAAGAGGEWLAPMESALGAWPGDAAVAAAAGRIFAERGLWGKARRPLEQAAQASTLAARTRRACWRTLARLAREEGDDARAASCDRAAAEIA